MRALIIGTKENTLVIGEPVSITGSDEKFIVHRSVDKYELPWSLTHVATSHAFGYGETPDEAIAHGVARWISRPPEQLAKALARAMEITNARIAERGLKVGA